MTMQKSSRLGRISNFLTECSFIARNVAQRQKKCQADYKSVFALATNIGDTFLYENGKESGGETGEARDARRSMSRSLLLARGKNYLSRCIESGGWIFTGRSPNCFFAERSFAVLFPSDPGDAAARPLAPPAPPFKILYPSVFPFSCVTHIPLTGQL